MICKLDTMKNYLFILFPFIFASIVCEAQDTVKRNVPLLKESIKIDSLILSVINIPDYLKAPKNDSCIVLSLSKNDVEKYIYGAHALNHREIIFDLGGNLIHNKSVGYFEFKGYLIFVYGDAFKNDFFSYTEKKRTFAFVKPKPDDIFPLIRGYMSWAVIYRDGGFNYGVH